MTPPEVAKKMKTSIQLVLAMTLPLWVSNGEKIIFAQLNTTE
jgi:hypothetical protein